MQFMTTAALFKIMVYNLHSHYLKGCTVYVSLECMKVNLYVGYISSKGKCKNSHFAGRKNKAYI